MTKDCVYAIPCSSGRKYKGETGEPLKVRLQEHQKAVAFGEVEKSAWLTTYGERSEITALCGTRLRL